MVAILVLQVGLAEIIKASFPYKEVYVVGKDFPSLNWIGKMDDLKSNEFNDALVIVVDTANAPRGHPIATAYAAF